jgi:NAD(P)-dependent dehydrogenase (short-subunit alcohol dehydrogenase family)
MQETAAAIGQAVSLGRFGGTEEVGGIAAFLAWEQTSYMTAAECVVDGGYAA